MPFEVSQLSPPFNTPVRFTEFNWPGGLRWVMGAYPTEIFYPFGYPDPPYTQRYIYGSNDFGEHWAELAGPNTHVPFSIEPVDSGIDRVLNAVYCGNLKVVGRALDNQDSSILRIESNDGGSNWSMKEESTTLTLTDGTAFYTENTQADLEFAYGSTMFTMRPQNWQGDAGTENFVRANVYKSTDYGDTNWTQVGTVDGWNCRGICYIGNWEVSGPNFGKERLLCVADLDTNGVFQYSETNSQHYSHVMRSDDGGATWKVMWKLVPNYNAPHGQSSNGWRNHSKFAYLGDGVVLLLTDVYGDESWYVDSAVFRSEDYGSTWTEIARIPKSPVLIPYLGDPVPDSQNTDQYSLGIWYLGEKGQEDGSEVPYVYINVGTSFVMNFLSAPNYNLRDQWYSIDGGYTWEPLSTVPRIINYGDPETTTVPKQVWTCDACWFIEDNGAIPGRYG